MTTPSSRELMDVRRVTPAALIRCCALIPEGPGAVNLENYHRISMILNLAGSNGFSEMAAGVKGATTDGPLGCVAI